MHIDGLGIPTQVNWTDVAVLRQVVVTSAQESGGWEDLTSVMVLLWEMTRIFPGIRGGGWMVAHLREPLCPYPPEYRRKTNSNSVSPTTQSQHRLPLTLDVWRFVHIHQTINSAAGASCLSSDPFQYSYCLPRDSIRSLRLRASTPGLSSCTLQMQIVSIRLLYLYFPLTCF